MPKINLLKDLWLRTNRHGGCPHDQRPKLAVFKEPAMTRTIGAAIGAAIIVLFFASIGTRQHSRALPAPQATVSQR